MRVIYSRSSTLSYRMTQLALWVLCLGFAAGAWMTRETDASNNHQAFIWLAAILLVFAVLGEWALRRVVTRIAVDQELAEIETMSSSGRVLRRMPRSSLGFGARNATKRVFTKTWRQQNQKSFNFVLLYTSDIGWPLFVDVTKDKLSL